MGNSIGPHPSFLLGAFARRHFRQWGGGHWLQEPSSFPSQIRHSSLHEYYIFPCSIPVMFCSLLLLLPTYFDVALLAVELVTVTCNDQNWKKKFLLAFLTSLVTTIVGSTYFHLSFTPTWVPLHL